LPPCSEPSRRSGVSPPVLGPVDDRLTSPADVGPMTVRRRVTVAGHPPDEHLVRPPRVTVRALLRSLLNQRTEHAFEDKTYRSCKGPNVEDLLLGYSPLLAPPAGGQTRSRSPLRVDAASRPRAQRDGQSKHCYQQHFLPPAPERTGTDTERPHPGTPGQGRSCLYAALSGR